MCPRLSLNTCTDKRIHVTIGCRSPASLTSLAFALHAPFRRELRKSLVWFAAVPLPTSVTRGTEIEHDRKAGVRRIVGLGSHSPHSARNSRERMELRKGVSGYQLGFLRWQLRR